MRALETSIQSGEHSDLLKTARQVFLDIMADPDVFPSDMPEASRVSMLGVNLRRYARFQRLLDLPAQNQRLPFIFAGKEVGVQAALANILVLTCMIDTDVVRAGVGVGAVTV